MVVSIVIRSVLLQVVFLPLPFFLLLLFITLVRGKKKYRVRLLERSATPSDFVVKKHKHSHIGEKRRPRNSECRGKLENEEITDNIEERERKETKKEKKSK